MTLTDVISKRIVYGKRVIVNDNSANDTIEVNQSGSGDAVRITQTGSGNALVVEDSTNPDSTPFIVNSDGKILSGTTQYINAWNQAQTLVLAGLGNPGMSIIVNGDSSNPGVISFAKSRADSPGSLNPSVQDNDKVGTINFSGADGSNLFSAARINGAIDSSPGSNDMPGRLEFLTTPSGSINPLERMRITNQGRVGIGTTSPGRLLHVDGLVRLQGLPTHANNAAAIAGGLVADDVYKTATGELRIVV